MYRFLLAVMLALTSAPAWACSCIPTKGWVSEAVADHVVFVGTALQTTFQPLPDGDGRSIYGQAVTKFEVNYPLQLMNESNAFVRHQQDGAACGMNFNMGDPTLIIAWKPNDTLLTNSCSYSIPNILIKDWLVDGNDFDLPTYEDCNSDDVKSVELEDRCKVTGWDADRENYKKWNDWLRQNGVTN